MKWNEIVYLQTSKELNFIVNIHLNYIYIEKRLENLFKIS